MEDILTPIPDLTDGEPVPEALESQVALESYTLSISDYSSLAVSSVPIGALCGAIFMIVGLVVMGIVKIFKKA